MFYKQARNNKGKAIIRYKNAGQWIDIRWEEEQEYVESFALGLLKLGVAPSEKVAILSENRYEWYVSDLAIQSIGAIVVPIYATNTPQQIRYIINNSESVAIIASTSQQLDKLRGITNDVPGLRYIITKSKRYCWYHR